MLGKADAAKGGISPEEGCSTLVIPEHPGLGKGPVLPR